MIRLMLVDDEASEREGLRDYMPWERLGIEVAGEASDGMQALKLAKVLNPDIVVSDIRMPGMDGLEFITQLKNTSPGVKVVFISGYQDFEYARNAITLNASSYVLKPVNFEKLAEVLNKAVLEIKEEQYSSLQKEELRRQIRENQHYLKQQFLMDILLHRHPREAICSRAEYLGLHFTYEHVYVAVITIDDYTKLVKILTEENKQFLNITVFNLLMDIVIPDTILCAVQLQENLFAVILNTQDEGALFRDRINGAFEEFQQKLAKTSGETATVGISEPCKGVEEAYIGYRQAMAATHFKWYLGKGQVILSSESSVFSSPYMEEADIYDQIREILQYTFAGDVRNALECIGRLFTSINGKDRQSRQYVHNVCLTLTSECRRLLIELGENPDSILGSSLEVHKLILEMETCHEVEIWLMELFEKVDAHIQEKRMAKNSKLVARVIDTIHHRYHENIGVEDICREVFLSPNYIRKVFKNETGHTITEFLLNHRMKKAAELMKNPLLHVYDIGASVGYENTSYFCQVFKQHFGVTPKEYMDSL